MVTSGKHCTLTTAVILVISTSFCAGGYADEYDPDTKVYCDALWFRVHAENCPSLTLKEKKKTMTLAEADRAGARIGESGQSGREKCCFPGYQRKHPVKKLPDDIILFGNDRKKNVKHLLGCHRFSLDKSHMRRTRKEWVADGFTVCPHCIERGPSLTTLSAEEWDKIALGKRTIRHDMLPFEDPLATVEQFICRRYFFGLGGGNAYVAYRNTGDKRILDALLESARPYHKLCVEYPSATQHKAGTTEGVPFMFPMAQWSLLTLQLARKYPGTVSKQGLLEAEAFLKTIRSVLKPTWEASAPLDPDMGLPRKVADDFRTRAFNRAMNGIGTIAMASAAFQDLQALKKTKEYQPTIDRYRKTVREYIRFWKSRGHFCTFDGRNHFYYPYGAGVGEQRVVDGCKILGRPEDTGHFRYLLIGLTAIYESSRDLGVDDDLMTALANTLYHNARVAQVKVGKARAGLLQCPTGYRVHKKSMKGKNYIPGRPTLFVLHAFSDEVDFIDGLCSGMSRKQMEDKKTNDPEARLWTLHGEYMKALRKGPSLIHLGERK